VDEIAHCIFRGQQHGTNPVSSPLTDTFIFIHLYRRLMSSFSLNRLSPAGSAALTSQSSTGVLPTDPAALDHLPSASGSMHGQQGSQSHAQLRGKIPVQLQKVYGDLILRRTKQNRPRQAAHFLDFRLSWPT
jgi:hypothetical protein